MIVEFRARLKQLAAKDTKKGTVFTLTIECIGLAEEDAAGLMREIGETLILRCEQPQMRLPLKAKSDDDGEGVG